MRAKSTIEELRKEREALIFTEIPYQVNKATLVEKIAELVREKKIEGIADLRDESDRDGMRIVVELKRDAVADVVLNQLYRYTPLQTSFGANMVALNGGRPELLNLKDLIRAFVDFREEVVSPPHQAPAGQGARARARLVRPRHRRRQHRRGDPPHPHRARSERGPRGPDGAQLAGRGHRAVDRARRRSRGTVSPRTAPTASRRRRPGPSSISACSASRRSAATRSPRSCRSLRPKSQTIWTSCARARESSASSRTNWPPSAKPSRRRARPRSSTGTPRSTTRI